jgi:hypothetical protein
MILISLILSQVVRWELQLPHHGYPEWARDPLILLGGKLIFGSHMSFGLPDTIDSIRSFCTMVDTATGAIIWDTELREPDWSIITTLTGDGDCFYAGGYGGKQDTNGELLAWNLFVAKLNSSGDILWVRHHGDFAQTIRIVGQAAMVDPGGNLVCGGTGSAPGRGGLALRSWDHDGNFRWQFFYEPPPGWGPYQNIWGLRMDDEGSIYGVGTYDAPSAGKQIPRILITQEDYGNFAKRSSRNLPCDYPAIFKVDSAGHLVWVDTYKWWNKAGELTVCEYWDNGLYVAGMTHCGGKLYNGRVDKYGGLLWYRWDELYNFFINIDASCLDSAGNFYITGDASDSTGMYAFVASHNPQGKRRILQVFFPGTGWALASDRLGNIFLGGTIVDSLGNEFAVAKMDTLGNLKWLYRKDGESPWPGIYGDACYSLLPDNHGGVFAMGRLFMADSTAVQYLVHLADTTGGISEGSESERGLVLTPTPSGFLISGYEGEARVYDPAGRLILTREIKGKTPISPLSPGVYFVVAGRQRAKVAVQ